MRKITEQATNAFFTDQAFRSSNTEVRILKDGTGLFLHNNLIAFKNRHGVQITSQGWFTNTTKERLNGVLDRLNVPGIYQKKGEWYLNNEQWNGFWKKVS